MKENNILLENEEVFEALEMVRYRLFDKEEKVSLTLSPQFQKRLLTAYLKSVDYLILCIMKGRSGKTMPEYIYRKLSKGVRQNFKQIYREAKKWYRTGRGNGEAMEDAFFELLDFYKSVFDDDLLI